MTSHFVHACLLLFATRGPRDVLMELLFYK